MKRKIFVIAAVSAMFLACDPAFDIECFIKNGTNTKVTVVSPNFNVEIASGNESVINGNYGDLGGASRGECEHLMKLKLSDSVAFMSESGDTVVFHKTDTTGLSPYNFKSSAYTYEDKSTKFPKGDPNSPIYGKLTYKITDEIFSNNNAD